MTGLLFCASAYAGLLAHLAFRAADDYERAATFDLMDRGDRNRALLRAMLLHWLGQFGAGNPLQVNSTDFPALHKVMLMLEGQHATQAIAEDEGLGATPFTAPLA